MAPPERLRLGNYEPLLQLATGGMATVYVARQLGAAGFERLVVLKRVHRHLLSNHEFRAMFVDEARVASLIRHPNVAPVIDVVESDGELFLVMEYIESTALSTLLKAVNVPPLKPQIVVRIIADALAGLHAAHEVVDMRGNHLELVHRDVSPQNIVVGLDGTSRLIDFGVAKARHRVVETRSGSLKGKYGYMAPEQTRGADIDRRADLFAVGIVLHETLTGRRLFQGDNEFETMRRVLEAPVAPPSSIAPGIPASLDAVVARALARDPAQRFQTAAQFQDALEAALAPAASREVAACVQIFCGERLEQRRADLHALLEGRAAPSEGPFRADRNTIPDTPIGRRRALVASEETESQIAATHDAPPTTSMRPGRASRTAIYAAVLGVLGVVIALLVFGLGARRRAPAASAEVPAEAPPKGVELTVIADAPIESLSAPGTRELEVRGANARLVVTPWTGALELRATLEGKRAARATVQPGEREARLVEVPAAPPATSSDPALPSPRDLPEVTASAAPPPSSTAPRRKPSPAPARPAAAPPPASELHSNPYGSF